MFEFFKDIGNYDDRKVGRYDEEETGLMVSTATVSDSSFPYETAVAHQLYNYGKMVIVENYSSKEDAVKGHKQWVKTMTAKTLPDKLIDVSGAGIAGLLDVISDEEWRVYPIGEITLKVELNQEEDGNG